jgi:thiol-disulfide isomerase/thioredoxin
MAHFLVPIAATLRSSAHAVSFAEWCGACRAMKPQFYSFFQQAHSAYPNLRIASVNYDEGGATSARFRIISLPTIYQYCTLLVIRRLQH